jgi:UDP-MurNAc hydroxylase
VKITFIGNACQVLEQDCYRILADPWIEGPAFESWRQFPPLKTKAEDLLGVDMLYISHLHQDHCHEPTLRHFRRDIPIVVLRDKGNYIFKILTAMGFSNVQMCDSGQGYLAGPFRITLYAPFVGNAFFDTELGNLIDSAIVYEAGGHKVFSAVDNPPDVKACKMLTEVHGKFDLAQLPYTAAGPFPACFDNLSEGEKLIEANAQVKRNLDQMIVMAKALDTKLVQPFAGAYCLGGKLWELNDVLGIASAYQAWEALCMAQITAVSCDEGNVIDLDDRSTVWMAGHAPTQDARAYAESTKDEPYAWESDEFQTVDWFLESFMLSLANLTRAQERMHCWPDCNVTINGFAISMKKTPFGHSKNRLECDLDSRLLARVLKRQVNWNDVEVGCHLRYYRTGPYLPDLHTILSFFHL